jgi:hypothetical protein
MKKKSKTIEKKLNKNAMTKRSEYYFRKEVPELNKNAFKWVINGVFSKKKPCSKQRV